MTASHFYIDETARIGVSLRMLQGCVWSSVETPGPTPKLPTKLYVGPFAVIGADAVLGEEVVVDTYCSIDPRARIGDRTVLIYRATVGGDAVIGDDCVIGGFVSENCHIGDRCRMIGSLIHTHEDPTISWDHHEIPEQPPLLEDNVFVGFGALVIGGVRLHSGAYVCARAVITRDVPAGHIAYGVNQIVPAAHWKGRRLKDSAFFRR